MRLAVIPIIRNGMKAISTAMGMVMAGIIALGGCHRKMNTIMHHGEDHLDERGLQVADGPVDQVGAVIDRHDLHAVRQARLDFPNPGLDPVNHLQGVLTMTHDDDAGDDFAGAVQVGHAPPQVGAEGHLGDIADPDGRAVAAVQDEVLEVFERADITVAADHVFGAAELQQPPAGLDVAAAQRLDDPPDRNAVGLQAVRVEVDLELLARYQRLPLFTRTRMQSEKAWHTRSLRPALVSLMRQSPSMISFMYYIVTYRLTDVKEFYNGKGPRRGLQ